MQSYLVYTFIFSFAFGIAWQDIFELNTAFAVFLLVLGASLLLIAKTTKSDLVVRYLVVLTICIFAFTLGTVRMQIAQDAINKVAHIYDAQLGEQVEVVGIVVDEPDMREYTTNLVVEVLSKHIEVGPLYVLVKVNAHQNFKYGDEVVISGKLEKPKNFTGDTGRVFDYIGYLAKDNVHYMIKRPKVNVLSHNNGNNIKMWLYNMKQKYVDILGELVPEPEAGLAAGITVGAKRALGSELLEAFRNTGLIHIVVLSGFNVTIIIIFLIKILAFLPRWAKYSIAIVSVILFTILTGADAPVARASAMGLLGVAAILLGRTYNITRALFIVALAMIVWNPMILLHDIAFQLSVVATLGLIYIAPPIIKRISPKHIRELSQQRLIENEDFFNPVQSTIDIIGVTIAAQIAVLPLLIYYMGEVSVVAVIVNVLALPIIPIAMLFAFLAGVIGIVSTSMALPFAYATYGLLAYIVWLVEFFNALPMTTLQIF